MSQLSKVEPDKEKNYGVLANWIIRISYRNLLISVLQPLFCQIHILEHFFTFSCTSSLSYENITYMIPVSTSFFFLKPEYRHYYFHQFDTWVILWSYEVMLRSYDPDRVWLTYHTVNMYGVQRSKWISLD